MPANALRPNTLDGLSHLSLSDGSGRFAESSGSFGSIEGYPVCGCCGRFHAVFDDGTGPLGFLNGDDRGGTASGKPSLTVTGAGAQLTRNNVSWATSLGQPATVDFSFRSSAPTTMPSDTAGFSRFSDTQIAVTLLALQSWSDVANITFNRVDDGDGYSNNATMVFGNYSSGSDGAAAFAYLPNNRAVTSNSGDVWINSSLSYNATPVALGYGFQVITHEIGHAIGLSHPSAYNAGPGQSLSYANNASYYEDTRQYSVMSYFSESNTGGSFGGRYSAVPLLDDIAAAQRLYGANMTTRTGDTVYGFNSTAGRSWFEATSASTALIFAVWDAGGQDTFDFSGYVQNQVIDLRQGAFSNVGALIGNVAIAVGAVIEAAIGGSGNDTLYGNAGDNTLTGGAGNDTIDGGLGVDTVVFSGARSGYTVTWNGRVGTVTGPDGTDTLTNVEFLRFADQTIAAAPTGGLIVSGDITNNVMTGSDFADTLSGGGGDDSLSGGAGDDNLNGGFGNDTILGGSGNDLITGGLGNDTLAGGDGYDIADYSGATGGVTVSLLAGTASGAAGSDTLSGFEELRGGADSDTLSGDNQGNVILGGGGMDTLNGLGGNDVLTAGAAVSGGGAPDIVKAQATANATRATAVSLDDGFDLVARSGVHNATTVPHATVVATTHGGPEFYAFTATAGATVSIDIDNATFDSVVRIYDASGNLLATNDDGSIGSDLGPSTDSGLSLALSFTGTYYVEVTRWVSGSDATLVVDSPPAGQSYTMHVSVPGHPVVAGVLTGSTLNGGDGDDVLNGSVGVDILRGDDGNDAIYGGGGNDDIDGGLGTDTAVFNGPRSAYTITTADGVTTVAGPDGSDTLRNVERLQFQDQVVVIGAPAGVNLFGTAGDDVLSGEAGDDVLTAGSGNDVLFGGAGNDILYGGFGADQLNGDSGIDTAWYETGVANGYLVVDLAAPSENNGEASGDTYASIERVVGSISDDIIRGTAAAEFFVGREGNDIFQGRGGGDTYDGGVGLDTVWYDQAAIIDLRDWSTNSGAAAGDSFTSIERVVASEQDDVIRGTSATEYFVGRGGNDVFQGRGGGDVFDGGAGIDTVWYDQAAIVDLRDQGTNGGAATGDRYESIERVVGSELDDVIRGTAATDYFLGRGGNDVFQGRGGGDIFDGGAGLDTVWYDEAAIVDLAGLGNGGAATGDIYVSIERVVGSNQADIVRGTSGADYFVGRDGDDIFLGRGGGDTIDGGAGMDTVWYDAGVVGGTLLIDLLSSGRNTGAAAGDRYVSVERVVSSNLNDYVLGTDNTDYVLARDGDDTIEGRGGNDILDGGAGNDRIAGGAGADLISGGTGADAFIYFAAAEGGDVITDFQSGVDKFEFHSFNLTGNAWFVSGAGPTSAQAQLIWDASTGRLLWDSDGTGAGGAVLIATLQAGATVTAADISRIQNGVPQAVVGTASKPDPSDTEQTVPQSFAKVPGFDDPFVLPPEGDRWPEESILDFIETRLSENPAFGHVIDQGNFRSSDHATALWHHLPDAPDTRIPWTTVSDWDL